MIILKGFAIQIKKKGTDQDINGLRATALSDI